MEVYAKMKKKEFEQALLRSNMTMIEVASECGINRIYLSNIKNSKATERPSGKLRKRILDVLNEHGAEVRFDDIFEIVDNKVGGNHAKSGDKEK